MFVIPQPGMRVRDPVKKDYLPDAGREIGEMSAYWRRRVSDGDATSQDAPPPGPPPESRKSAAVKKLGSD